MPRFELAEVGDLQSIKGVPFPSGVSFRQLIVTGPPGVGKTTLVTAIGGWPEEGFLDLVAPNWWRSRVLAFRPRQLHLGLPFRGHRKGLSVFDDAFLDDPELPELELDRIRLPPLSGRRDPWRLRRKYVFDFLLPPAEEVFEARVRRSERLSHRVDEGLTLDRVGSQLDISWRVARHLHHAGLVVYVRDAFGGPPRVFADPPSTDLVEKQLRGEVRGRGRSVLMTQLKRIISPSGYRVVDRYERVDLRGRRALVPRRVLPVSVEMGDQRLEIHADRTDAVRILDPLRYFERPAGFARLEPGDLLRLPDARVQTPDLPAEGPARVEIGNEGDWLTVVDLDSPSGTRLQSLHAADAERLENDRAERVARLRTLLDGMPPFLPPEEAEEDLRRAITQLEEGEWRRRDSRGEPGGLVDVPDDVIPIVVGDLHGRVDNLITILSEGRTLDALALGRAALLLLGDVVHPEEGDLADMTSSLLITDVVVRLMLAFPGRIIHLRGNHETFSSEMTKGGLAQGRLWKTRVTRERGPEGLRRMRRFYELLPYVATGRGFIACHAGPPTANVSRKRLIDIHDHARLGHQLTWGRVRTPRRPGGYTKRDVRALQKALDQPKPSVLLVSHNPGSGQESVQLDHGGIKRHHLVFSARPDHVAAFTRIDGLFVPLVYPSRDDFTRTLAHDGAS